MSIRKGRLTSQGLTAAPVNFPSGTIISFAGATAPLGWAICDGSTVSRTEYAGLFSAIGTAWGNGNGTTTFHLPDLRGRFLRGVDGAAGVDVDKASRTAANAGGNTGNNVGSIQGHAMQSHNHVQAFDSLAGAGRYGSESASSSGVFDQAAATSQPRGPLTSTRGASGTHAQASANETRPVNAAVNYIIKL